MEKLQKQTVGPIGLIAQARNGILVTSARQSEIKATLATCCSYLGITQAPDYFATSILIEFVSDKLKLYTLEELILAFKNLAANEYTCENEHYGKLSPAYLKDVMDAYKYWRDKYRGEEHRKELEPIAEDITINYKDCYEFIDDWCRAKKKIPYGASWSQAYDYMHRENIINPTEDEKTKIKAVAARSASPKHQEDFARACKKEYVIQHFEEQYKIIRDNTF